MSSALFTITNVEYVLNGIVKVTARNSVAETEIVIPRYELDVELDAGLQFAMKHDVEPIADLHGDLHLSGVTAMRTPDYVLISNGGLMLSIRTLNAAPLNVSEYGQDVFTRIDFRASKKRGRAAKAEARA